MIQLKNTALENKFNRLLKSLLETNISADEKSKLILALKNKLFGKTIKNNKKQ